MKIKLIEDPEMEEDMIITSKTISPELMQFVDSMESKNATVIAQHRGQDLRIHAEDVLFFETEVDGVVVHLNEKYYKTKYKLYSLVENLPPSFMRVSKSCIINIDKVAGYERSITSSRLVFFTDSKKTSYVSRMYFSQFKDRLIERSL